MTFPGSSTAFPAPSDAGKPGASRAPRFGYTTALSGLRQGAGSHPVVIRTAPRIAGWMRPELWIGPKPMPGPIRGHTPGTEQWAHHLPARLLALQSACAKNFMSFQTTAIKKQPASGPAAMDTPPPSPWAEGRTTPLDPPGGGAHCSPRSARRRGSPPRPVSPGRLAWSAPDSTRCRVDTLPHGHTTTRILCRTDTPRRHVRSSGSTDSGRSRYTPPPMGKGPRETAPHTGTCRSSRAPLPALLCRGEPPDHFFRRGSGWPWKHFPGRKTRARTAVQNHCRSKPPSFKTTVVQNHRCSKPPSFKFTVIQNHHRSSTPPVR